MMSSSEEWLFLFNWEPLFQNMCPILSKFSRWQLTLTGGATSSSVFHFPESIGIRQVHGLQKTQEYVKSMVSSALRMMHLEWLEIRV